MSGTYFLPRLLVAFIIPLTLASLGPAESHPELGTGMGSLRPKKSEVYRADDVRTQVALFDAQKQRKVTKLRAYRRGKKIHLKRRDG